MSPTLLEMVSPSARAPASLRRIAVRVRLSAFVAMFVLALAMPPLAAPTAARAGASDQPDTVELLVRGPRAAATVRSTDDATVVNELPSLGGVNIRVPAGAAERIARALDHAPGVDEVEENVPYTLAEAIQPNDPDYARQWRHPLTRTDRAWAGGTGSSDTVIAVVDTGVDATEPDLLGRVLTGRSVAQPTELATVDLHGHGTEVALVAAADGDNSIGVAGGCWECRVLPLRIDREDGTMWSSDIAEAIVWASDNGAHIINLSLGGSHTSAVESAVAYAAERGVLLIAAAGNAGKTKAAYPARYPAVVGVEASNVEDELYSFSNRGDGVDIAAPGCEWSSRSGSWFCGTSAAAPVVSGIAALAWATGTVAAPGELFELLVQSATPAPALTAGRVDALSLLGDLTACEANDAHLLAGVFTTSGVASSGCFDPHSGNWPVRADADGPVAPAVWNQFRTTTGWQSHLIADPDGDGLEDVLSYHPGTGNWIHSRSDGSSFTASVWATFRTQTGWETHLAGPVTAAGRTDVLSYHPGTGNWVRTTETGSDVQSSIFTRFRTRTGWDTHLLADVTGNGRDDLLSYHPGTGNWILTRADGGGANEVFTRYRTRTGWDTHLLADVTGNGRADLLSYHPGTGNWILTRADGGGANQVFTRYRTLTGWDTHDLADVTGDGRADLVSHHGSRGSVVVTRPDHSSEVWARVPTSGFAIIDARDATGDEVADLHVRDGGVLKIRPSTGTSFSTP